jgi:hypothetical protein
MPCQLKRGVDVRAHVALVNTLASLTPKDVLSNGDTATYSSYYPFSAPLERESKSTESFSIGAHPLRYCVGQVKKVRSPAGGMIWG